MDGGRWRDGWMGVGEGMDVWGYVSTFTFCQGVTVATVCLLCLYILLYL